MRWDGPPIVDPPAPGALSHRRGRRGHTFLFYLQLAALWHTRDSGPQRLTTVCYAAVRDILPLACGALRRARPASIHPEPNSNRH